MPDRPEPRVPAALAADIGCVVMFSALGRRSHGEGLTLAGVAGTAWPFLIGLGVGWLVSRAWHRPGAVLPTGLTIWVCTVAVAMVGRRATGAGTPAGFVVVATVVTGLLLVGWRTVRVVLSRRAKGSG